MSSDGEDSTIVHREEWRNEITERARFLILSEEERQSEDGQIMIRDFEERFRKAICESKQYGIFPPHTARNIGPPSRGLKPRSERNGGSPESISATKARAEAKRIAKETWKKRFKPLRLRQK